MKNFYENPEVQSINRLPMRSPLFPYKDEKLALQECCAGPESLPFTRSSSVKLLDGEWDFILFDNPVAAENRENYKAWKKIKVPGTWTLQGFDKPHYTNVQMPFDTIPPYVPQENPTGVYRLITSVPSEWRKQRIVLHVGSAESVSVLYINGQFAGLSKDTRLPFEIDVTPYIDYEGENEILIKVIRYSDASFIEDQDQWWFGGIHRSVYLYSTDIAYIEDIECLSKLEGDRGILPLYLTVGYGSSLEKDRRLTNSELDVKEYKVKYSVYEIEGSVKKGMPGKLVASGTSSGKTNLRANLNQIRMKIQIDSPKLWNHETPNLYAVLVSLFDEKENLLEATSFTTGFKSIAISNRELLINGKKVYIKGVNRHEHSEKDGKTLTTDQMVKDLHLLKSYNFNAVRTCHYPDDERWYDLCNRYGIYILDEANIENHAYYDVMPRGDEWTNAYMLRIQRMVRRDKNNVCIFGWSLGNESGDGQNQVAAQAWIRRVDKTRVVLYEGFVRPVYQQGDYTLESLSRGKNLTDIVCPMYPPVYLLKDFAEKIEDFRPLIMCEYSHAMGNANGSLYDYWKTIYSTHGLQGGFIWDWIDQGIAAEESKGKKGEPQGGKYWKYGGDFGDTPADYDFCLNGLLFPDQTPKPAMEECRKIFAPLRFTEVDLQADTFQIESHFDFIDVNNIQLKWTVTKNGSLLKHDTIPVSALNPGQSMKVKIPVSEYVDKSDAHYVLTTEFCYAEEMDFAPKNWVLFSEQIVLNRKLKSFDKNWLYGSLKKTVDISRLKSIVESFTPTVFRPLTENEAIKRQLPDVNEFFMFCRKPTKLWLKAGIDNERILNRSGNCLEIFSGVNAENSGKFADVSYVIEKALSPLGTDAFNLKIDFELMDFLPEYPRAGIMLKIPASFDSVQWYGKGPHENYSDRDFSAHFGLYEKMQDEMEVPYIVPQENGTRTQTGYLCLSTKDASKVIHIQSGNLFSFNYSKYSDKDIWKKEHHNELIDLSALENGYYELHIDAAIRGVGTGACGPDTLDSYKVKPGHYALDLLFY